MKDAFVIIGSTLCEDEYRKEWFVRLFFDEKQAKESLAIIQSWLTEQKTRFKLVREAKKEVESPYLAAVKECEADWRKGPDSAIDIYEDITNTSYRLKSVPYDPNELPKPKPQVTRVGVLDMQICVPAEWTDEQVTSFANSAAATGIRSQWRIRKEGHEALQGDPERQPCNDRVGCVHIMLEC